MPTHQDSEVVAVPHCAITHYYCSCERSIAHRNGAVHLTRPMLMQGWHFRGGLVDSASDMQDTTGSVFWHTLSAKGVHRRLIGVWLAP